jgi:hypothetical protein
MYTLSSIIATSIIQEVHLIGGPDPSCTGMYTLSSIIATSIIQEVHLK